MKTIITLVATMVTATAAAASNFDPPLSTAVPEISALEGTAALAVVAAIILLAWERRRKAA